MNVQSLARFTGVLLFGAISAKGQLILSDNYNVTTSGTGFALGSGINTGINPPTTRFTGSAAANLRYYQTVTGKAVTAFDINANRLRVNTDAGIGRFTLSADSATPYDFASDLGSLAATPASPAAYDLRISMRNNATSNARFSFALGTVEGDATTWDFGLQLFRATTSDSFYTVQRRVDIGSSGVPDLNAAMTVTAASTWQTSIDFLIRVTDAGAESSTYNSRVQVSMDNGTSWFYDTATDGSLPNGFRLDGTGRYIMFDQAGNSSGAVFYDNFSITSIPEPSMLALGGLTAVALLIRRKR